MPKAVKAHCMRLANGSAKPFILPIITFALAIFAGAFLLALPAFRNTEVSYVDALFTATSAFCVTGLSPFDAFAVFNRCGQTVILILMQLGGIGIIALTTLAGFLLNNRVTLSDRIALEQGMTYDPRHSLKGFLVRVVVMVFMIETVGAFCIWLFFPGDSGLFNPVFLSVSAFCNAGFAPWGDNLEQYRTAYGLNIIVMALIILGGLGFFVLDELGKRLRALLVAQKARPMSFYSKLVLKTTCGLVLGGAAALFFLGCINPGLDEFSLADRLCSAFFESVTSRTAGFQTLNQENLSSAALLLVIFLMFIGGSPGSCAGGIKTTTFRVLAAFMVANFKGRSQSVSAGRAFGDTTVHKALLLLAFSLHIVFAASFLILLIEQGASPHGQSKPFFDIFFEVVSALSTVGLSINLTPTLSDASKLILCILMFIGKLGPIWLLATVQGFQGHIAYRYAEENIPIG